MPFEDDEAMFEFINRQISEPAEYKLDATGQQVFRRDNTFGPLRDSWRLNMVPHIVDFSSALQLHGETGRGIMPIQPSQYRAPEVTLGFPWNRSADIWNLGTLVRSYQLKLYRNKNNPLTLARSGTWPREHIFFNRHRILREGLPRGRILQR
jgi:hypothetical protein